MSEAEPDLLEVNISCPNVASECGEPFAASASAAADVTRQVKAATRIPVIVKLAPNVPAIGAIAKAVEAAGADAICAVNTMPGMLIDAEAGAPVLANRSGGISGPALKPIALRCVAEIAQAVAIPIIGTGGVCTGTDCVEMLMAGACCVGVGSAVAARGADALGLILQELREWLAAHGVASLDAVQGLALRAGARPGPVSSPPPIPGWGSREHHG